VDIKVNGIPIIIRLVNGGVGGLGSGRLLPNLSPGKTDDIITGTDCGVCGGQLLGALDVADTTGGGTDIGSILVSVLGKGVVGGVLMAIASSAGKAFVKM